MQAHATYGTGERTVVLLHGFLGRGRNLASLAQAWVTADPSLRLLVPDLLGHGSAAALAPPPSLAQVADGVLAQIELLQLPAPAYLVGHSLGGRVALLARARQPAAVAGVVLLDIGPGAVADLGGLQSLYESLLAAPAAVSSRDQMRNYFAAGGFAPALVEWLLMNLAATPGGGPYTWRIDRAALAALQRDHRDLDLWPAAAAAAAAGQLACVRAANSTFVSLDDAERLRRLGAQVETLAGAGHFIHIDQPAALLANLRLILPKS